MPLQVDKLDVGDDIQVKAQRKKYKLKRQQEHADMRKLLESEGSRHLLWRFFEYCMIFEALPPMESNQLAMKTGIRNAGLWMLNEVLEVKPNMLSIMKSEANEREANASR